MATARLDNVFVWIAAFLVMGPIHARFAILMHESAHRLLFSNRRANDFVGKWLIAYPAFVPIDLYRRGHMAHHREEFGPNEPDIPLYRGYPIPRDSMLRKLRRDAFGITGWKLTKGLFRGVVAETGEGARTRRARILATQLVMLGALHARRPPVDVLHPLVPPAPHGVAGDQPAARRSPSTAACGSRPTGARPRTRCASTCPARLTIVPYYTGWHLAHHVDSGIPMRNLPRLHAELVRSGYVQPGARVPQLPRAVEGPRLRLSAHRFSPVPGPDPREIAGSRTFGR